MSIDPAYEMVIGLEVHAQMLTQSKIFCGCSTAFGAPANTQICPVCSGFPGVLPVLNKEAVNMAIKTGLAIEGEVRMQSEFSRKNYFYPDLPSGYQITQFELPIVEHGKVLIEDKDVPAKVVGITRIHMEVDAGKSIHEGVVGGTWVDLNRTGVPLMEIVSEPDMSTPEEAGAYLKKLRSIVRYLEVCDGNMEQGSFRCDANVSVRKKGDPKLGTRCELKNLNSIRNVMRAIELEAERHIDILEEGGSIVQETRLYDANLNETRSMRSKEDAHDYRYFPEPDLPLLVLSEQQIATVKATLPELPDAKRERFETAYGLSHYDASVLTTSRALSRYYETVVEQVKAGGQNDPKICANWVTVELLALLNKENKEIEQSPVSATNLAKMVVRILDNTISGKIAKEVFASMFESGSDPDTIIEEKGLKQITDSGAIEAAIDKVLALNSTQVEQYRGGQEKLFGFFIGQVMKATQGKANPAELNKLLKQKLGG
ncbi:aspartyl/glutamyl-tRNA(Asn/Gln) amidotransferase subunit B [Magnetococcus marinus MC-1]|uniref:Aspartyl/glutamyl-tRNA(Asn/Gln) amidotransferase subunit B n=1 Tax=Magnetococcus marinus (strain ATCC BAA-1437 / JCM 17883 / MC-1) TaxID=156889 RepID=A0L5F9_MAGMM|nr:Asp-tRNA(Asn)/Glu-tRNA(Gln) amidotransferase subunit GatB [Magnetococcus marinus]ABK43202.1 aspartyl/glutamyl-tRNA(Asn/Gln) amidotransferase subunit B [Magnetococcus marinus MC-1]